MLADRLISPAATPLTREQRARAMGSSRLALVLEAGRRHGAPVYTFG